MSAVNALTFRDLMAGHPSAEIDCLVKNALARRLTVEGDTVVVDALAGLKAVVTLDTDIRYEPWLMDRGSLLFSCPQLPDQDAKLCSEYDIVRYPDGTTASVICK